MDQDSLDQYDPTYQPDPEDVDEYYHRYQLAMQTHGFGHEDEYYEDGEEEPEESAEPPLSKGPMFQVPDIPYVSVEFPGYISNPDRALEMLGGPASIAKCLSTQPPDQPKNERPDGHMPLELRLSPEDPFAHPIFGEVIPTCNLLLRVVRRRRRGTDDPWEYVSQVRGIIHETGRFRGMADYQWMPDPSDPVTQLRQAMKSMDLETLKQFPLEVPDETELDNLRQFPPPIFSQVELPLGYDYKQNPAVVKVQIQHPDGTNSVRLLNRSREAGLPITTVASHHPPRQPTRNHDPLIARRVQRILPAVGYYFISGPWKMTWVRFGFDPRTDKSTRLWQTLDTRNHFKSGWQRAKRKSFTTGTGRQDEVHGHGEDDMHEDQQMDDLDPDQQADEARGASTASRQEIKSHVFDGVHVNDETSVFQFCDLVDPLLKELVDTQEYLRDTCDPFDGWYYRGLILKLRARLRNKRLALATGEPYVPPPEDYMEVVMDGDPAHDESGEQAASTADHPPRSGVLAEVDALMRNLNVPGDIFDVFDFDPFEDDDEDGNANEQHRSQQSGVPGRLSLLGSQPQQGLVDEEEDGEASDEQPEDDEDLSYLM
ncbi:RNA polymerase III transcription factor IIIC subunit-domain-containing protein [Catenaria anguillulae PL171]|uniref:RNA polymerase III transcription factor IIIC subunit-domain-containing protein n=1 Tax=Catenaria anguillulae PL171 TaxID=765915 RepID=A0A1Y2HZJ4_9FUNG|nr:RNA polymerase III transcription factor IIIC subunit-domain-containing protein [Catenaria anguillulae PL171]